MTYIKQYHTYLLCLLAGFLYALGFPLQNGVSFAFAPLFSFIFFNWSLDQKKSLKKQLLMCFVFSFGVFLMGFYWIPETIKEFGGLVFPFNFLLGIAFAVIVFPQMYFLVIAKKYIAHPILLALIFILLEVIIPQQFPAHLGHPFLSLTPFVNLIFAPIAGASFYSFFVAVLTFSFLGHLKNKKIPYVGYGFVTLVILCHLPFLDQKKPLTLKEVNIRIVQPNIGNFLKIESEKGSTNSITSVLENYYELSTYNISEDLDLIIWPETAYPLSLFSQEMKMEDYKPHYLFRDIAEETKAELFFGGYDSSLRNGKESYKSDYNAAFHLGSDGTLKNVYHKIKLIPFGEGLPFGPLNSYLSQYITNISYFSQGTEYTNFTTKEGISFASSICYEILFSGFIGDMLNGQKDEAQFMINLTNDSWYGDTSEPHQHLFLSKWRALEFNIPIIRSTNTGISTIIYPDGSESERLNVGEKNYLDLKLVLEDRQKTIYQTYGLLVVLLFGMSLLLIELVLKRKAFFQEIMKTNKA